MRNERLRANTLFAYRRLLRTDAENRRFWQRPRIAYNAPVFAGLIDCTGPVLLLVAVAGQMYAVGTFNRWPRLFAVTFSAAGFSTSKLLVKYRSNLWACPGRITQPNFQPSATSAICADHSAENSPQSNRGFPF